MLFSHRIIEDIILSWAQSHQSCSEEAPHLLNANQARWVSAKPPEHRRRWSRPQQHRHRPPLRPPPKASILHSRFSPSHFQLSLFASVIQGLDGQHLRIHDTTTGRLRCEHKITSRATISCLDWGVNGEHRSDGHHQGSKNKRKRSDKLNGTVPDPKDVVVALGMSDSEIRLFSPSESKVVAVLQGEHTQGVRDFRFSHGELKDNGWSIGGDGKILQWDLRKRKSIRSGIVALHGEHCN